MNRQSLWNGSAAACAFIYLSSLKLMKTTLCLSTHCCVSLLELQWHHIYHSYFSQNAVEVASCTAITVLSRQRQTCMRAAWGCSFASQICRQKWKRNFEHWFVDIICLSHGSCSLNGMWRVMSCGDWHMTVTEWHMTDLTFFQAKNTVNIVDGCCFCTQISYKQQADDTRDVSCSSIISSSNLRQTFEMSQKKKNKRKCKY